MPHADERDSDSEPRDEHEQFMNEFNDLAKHWHGLEEIGNDQDDSESTSDRLGQRDQGLAEIRDRLNRYVLQKEKFFKDYQEIFPPAQQRVWIAELREIREIQVALRQLDRY